MFSPTGFDSFSAFNPAYVKVALENRNRNSRNTSKRVGCRYMGESLHGKMVIQRCSHFNEIVYEYRNFTK